MNTEQNTTRREFLKTSTKVAAASALAGVAIPHVHAAGTDTINVALIGAGGRGTGAAMNALSVQSSVKLTAIADVFENKLTSSAQSLEAKMKDRYDVGEKKFIGFDAYKQAMDTLKPGDIAIFAAPVAFRWVHFQYAIEKGLNVFMEKPITVDGPSTRRMLKLGEESVKRGLKVGVGLMCRHCRVRQELYDRIRNGEIGDLILGRAYRMHGPVGSAFSDPKPADENELMFQIRRFHSFLWASGGLFSDFYIHNIDEACWMKNEWPVEAKANGGRHDRGNKIDQNFDTYSVEYTFADGTKFFLEGRTRIGCNDEHATYYHGTKGLAVVSKSGHMPARSKIFKGHAEKSENVIWSGPKEEPNPYQLEWDDFIDAIRNNKPYNEVERGAKASIVTAMGRWAAHTGQVINYDDYLNSEEELGTGLETLKIDGEAPIKAKDGKYPVPQPGNKAGAKWQEYYV
jgi:predicted dehydrogenase